MANFTALSEITLKGVSLLIKSILLASVTDYVNLSYNYFNIKDSLEILMAHCLILL